MATTLNTLRDNKGSRKRAKLLGRGIGSGKGKTSGRGGKGQTARTGVAINGFEGGQTPIHRRLPKRGFNNPTRRELQAINVGTIQKWIEAGRLSDKKTITSEVLVSSGIISNPRDGIKLLSKGEIKTAVQIEIDYASPSAIKAVEKAGGKVTVTAAAAQAAKALKLQKKPRAS